MQGRRLQRPSGPPGQAGALAALHGIPPPRTGDKSSLSSSSLWALSYTGRSLSQARRSDSCRQAGLKSCQSCLEAYGKGLSRPSCDI